MALAVSQRGGHGRNALLLIGFLMVISNIFGKAWPQNGQIDGIVRGECAPRFEPVREAFRDTFRQSKEIGASLCIYLDGQKVVDLWGGFLDPERTRPWKKDTIVCMMSTAKAMAAISAHLLVDRGLLSLNEPVSRYWPEFAQAGKEKVTVRQLLGHHAGIIYADAAPPGSFFNWKVMADAVAKQKPEWPPGTKGAYHSATYGFLVGELVRRVSGKPVGVFFREEVAKPLGIDYHIGLSDNDLLRVTDIHAHPENASLQLITNTKTKVGRAWSSLPKREDLFNSREFRQIELPSANGHGNARAIAKLFGAIARGGEIDGVRLLSPELIDQIRELQWDEKKGGMTGRPWRMGLGLFLNSPGTMPMGPNMNSFGHAGMGGALGFADPDAKLGFGFAPNYMNEGGGIGKWREELIDVVYRCLGKPENDEPGKDH